MKGINPRFLGSAYFHFFISTNITLGQFLVFGENRLKAMKSESLIVSI